MLQEYKKQTNIGVGFGIVAQLVGFKMGSVSEETAMFGAIFVLVGAILFLWGCGSYAKAKGYTGFLGILGLLHLLGLFMLVFLPDKHKDGKVPAPNSDAKSSSSLDTLERLAGMKEKGILTDEEFQQKKRELLG